MRAAAALTLMVAGFCYAEPEVKGNDAAKVYMIVTTSQLEVVLEAERELATPLTVKSSDIVVKFLPSGKTLAGNLITVGPQGQTGNLRRILLAYPRDDLTKPEKGDQKLSIEVKGIVYQGGTDPVTLKAGGVVYDSSNIQNLVKATSEALAPSKTTEEKDLFAGLNLTVPSNSGGAQGDIVFNRTVASLPAQFKGGLADAGTFGVKLKKGSQEGQDPRHFQFGFHLRKTVLMASREDLTVLRAAVSPGASARPSGSALAALDNVRSRFFRAFLADYGFQMEGDVSEKGVGNVSNLVFDAMPQLATAAKNAFGERGYFTFRFIPAGIELGSNLTNPDKQTKEVGAVSRYKAGAELRFYYQGQDEGSVLRRVELTAASTYRRLFQDEVAYDAKDKKNVSTTRGDKLWTQADFKIFLGPALGNVRPGLKVTYQRGYLPPVWARTKVFTYGLVFESVE